jgi:hypothetical protein
MAFTTAVIDRLWQLNEMWGEVALLLALADVVLDLPQQLIHGRELLTQLTQCAFGIAQLVLLNHSHQGLELTADVDLLFRISDALVLDLQDGDLVDQLTNRSRNQQSHQVQGGLADSV